MELQTIPISKRFEYKACDLDGALFDPEHLEKLMLKRNDKANIQLNSTYTHDLHIE